MADAGVKMTKDNGGGAMAVANVPADQVAIWEADGWKVAQEVKAKK
jgi:hypothetical protein